MKAMRIVEENPALRILINNMKGIALTSEKHKALHKYIETKDEITIFEYEYYYLALASTNIYNEKYEIYKTESNAKGRRYSKK